ncbi:MAG TPA: VRR-NUC domain-containing protein [Terriglobia bacterium]|nr:VRR-NUC domain-containing protein [Terriglobia bacterium]
MNRPEQQLQITVAQFLDMALPADAVWTAVNPVPGKTKAVAGLSKAMGLKAGFPDVLIFWQKRLYLIELKTDRGRLSPEQRDMMNDLIDAGAFYGIAKSLDEVIGHLTYWKFPLKARASA